MAPRKPEGLLGRLMNLEDPTRDVKLAGFGLTVLASVVWLSIDLWRRGITDAWNWAFLTLAGMTGLGAVGGEAIKLFQGRSNAKPPTQPGPAPEQKGTEA